MNTNPEYRVGVGASSILMIFIVLSLTTLGVLSFASARADLALSDRRQAQVEAYYAAEADAQALIAQIDEALYTAVQTPETYEASVRALESLDSAITVEEDLSIVLALPVGASQLLTIRLVPGGAEGTARYIMDEHYLLNIEEWEPDTTMNLADPIAP